MKIFYSERHLLHNPLGQVIARQPFVTEDDPERIERLLKALRAAQVGPVLPPVDHGIEPLLRMHTPDYLDFLQNAYEWGAAYYGEYAPLLPETYAVREVRRRSKHFAGLLGYYCFGTGTPILKGTWEAAYWSAQCALSGASQLLAGETKAYALCRPAGHHAASELYGGFCFLNNAAIAARALGERAAILDIDYHHGNGTQEIFYRDPEVFYCSLHADPDEDYPYYWGSAEENGSGPGLGANCNLPLPRGTQDQDYLRTLEQAIERVLAHHPRYLILSLGLDTASGDPAGGFCLTPTAFRAIGGRLASLNLPTLFVQEGGYRLESLEENIAAFFGGFIEASRAPTRLPL